MFVHIHLHSYTNTHFWSEILTASIQYSSMEDQLFPTPNTHTHTHTHTHTLHSSFPNSSAISSCDRPETHFTQVCKHRHECMTNTSQTCAAAVYLVCEQILSAMSLQTRQWKNTVKDHF